MKKPSNHQDDANLNSGRHFFRPEISRTNMQVFHRKSNSGNGVDEENVPNFGPDDLTATKPSPSAETESNRRLARYSATAVRSARAPSQTNLDAFGTVSDANAKRNVNLVDQVGKIRTKRVKRKLQGLSASYKPEEEEVEVRQYKAPVLQGDVKLPKDDMVSKLEALRKNPVALARVLGECEAQLAGEDAETGSLRFKTLLQRGLSDPKFKSFKFESNLERELFMEYLRTEEERLKRQIETRPKNGGKTFNNIYKKGPDFLLKSTVCLMVFLIGLAAGYAFFVTNEDPEAGFDDASEAEP